MTVERRFVVGLTDIRAVTCECKNCGGRVSLTPEAIAKVVTAERLFNCPFCGHVWFPGSITRDAIFVSEVLLLLVVLSRASGRQDDKDVGVRILFEFDEPSTPGASFAPAP